MTRLPAWLRRLMAMAFPWPARSSRHEAIAAARAEKDRSQAEAARAEVLRRQIEAMRQENHFASALVDQIIRQHSQGHGEGS